ncbi:MAG TPA: YqaA family protein [Rhizomicrobium sp.]|nr:YqaA family protein [Rhizomicrobium sp.]
MSGDTGTAERAGPLRGLYFWLMRHAEGRHAWTMLAIVAFAEASFFPIPPDVMLIPMALADRKRAFMLAGWCMLWSVLGGLLGYAIGSLLYDSIGQWLIRAYGYGADLEKFRALYAEYGAWIILIKGATPIPYKLVTIASGFAGYNLFLFVILSAITRGARFGIVAGLLAWFGEPIRNFIEKRLEYVMIGFLAVIILGFLIARYIV